MNVICIIYISCFLLLSSTFPFTASPWSPSSVHSREISSHVSAGWRLGLSDVFLSPCALDKFGRSYHSPSLPHRIFSWWETGFHLLWDTWFHFLWCRCSQNHHSQTEKGWVLKCTLIQKHDIDIHKSLEYKNIYLALAFSQTDWIKQEALKLIE